MFIYSCETPSYLPSNHEVGTNQYGSYIKVNQNVNEEILLRKGELISIDSSNIIVFDEVSKKCITIPINKVSKFKLKYAKSREYFWSIPVLSLSSIAHGFGLIITMPANIVVTSIVTTSGSSDYQFSKKNITYNEMRMFARFPQGIPLNMPLDSILNYPIIKKDTLD